MCFSLVWVEQLLIWLVVVCAIIAIVRLLVPHLLGPLGQPGTLVMQVINIIVWVVVAVFIIWILFGLLSCLEPRPIR